MWDAGYAIEFGNILDYCSSIFKTSLAKDRSKPNCSQQIKINLCNGLDLYEQSNFINIPVTTHSRNKFPLYAESVDKIFHATLRNPYNFCVSLPVDVISSAPSYIPNYTTPIRLDYYGILKIKSICFPKMAPGNSERLELIPAANYILSRLLTKLETALVLLNRNTLAAKTNLTLMKLTRCVAFAA